MFLGADPLTGRFHFPPDCSTGSTALFMARQFVQGGLNECVLAMGFEKMQRGSLAAGYTDRTNPMDQHLSVMADTFGVAPKTPFAPQMFGNAGREHMQRYGTTLTHFAKIAEKNHRHSANNPYSQFRTVSTTHADIQPAAAVASSAPASPAPADCCTDPRHASESAHPSWREDLTLCSVSHCQIYTLDQIMKSPMVHEPLTKLQW